MIDIEKSLILSMIMMHVPAKMKKEILFELIKSVDLKVKMDDLKHLEEFYEKQEQLEKSMFGADED